MNGLKVPKIFTSACIESEEAVGEKICSLAVGAVKVIGRRPDGEIRYPSLLINGYPAPCVGTAHVFPRIFRPGFITHFAGMRNCMKGPDELSCHHVEGSKVTGRGTVFFTGGRAQDEQILKDSSRGAGFDFSDGVYIAPQALP